MPRDSEKQRLYRLENRDAILAQQAKYREERREETRKKDAARREANREQIRAADRAAYAVNPEPKKTAARARHAANIDEIHAQKRAKHAANPEVANQRSIQWQKDNRERRNERERRRHLLHPEMHRLRNGRRRAREKALPDTFTLEQEAFMLAYWHHACAICGVQESFFWTLVSDHFIPLASSDCPGTIATNMLPMCHGQGSCNASKKDHNPTEWLIRRLGNTKATKMLHAITAYFADVQRLFPSTPSAAAD